MYPYFSTRKQIPRPIYAKELSADNDLLSESTSKLLDIIMLCIKNKAKNRSFYEQLLSDLKDEDNRIIKSIILDEQKHHKLLFHIHTILNGHEPENTTQTETAFSADISKSLSDALLDEAEAIKLYRELMSSAVT